MCTREKNKEKENLFLPPMDQNSKGTGKMEKSMEKAF
jgi:hypothetical protein